MLTELSPQRARWEIVESVKAVSEKTGQSFISFCYPNGDYNDEIIRMTKEACCPCSVTTLIGLVVPGDNPYTLKRMAIGDSPAFKFAVRITGC